MERDCRPDEGSLRLDRLSEAIENGPAARVDGNLATGRSAKSPRRLILFCLQVAVSVVLLVWLFSRGDFLAEMQSVILATKPGWFFSGLLVAGIVQVLCLIRWRIFLRMAGIRTGWRESGGVFFAGLFSNLFLPGGAGGDLVKIGLLATRGRDPGRSALSVVMDRLSGSVSMIVVGSGLILWRRDWLSQVPEVGAVMNGILIFFVGLAAVLVLSVALCARGVVSRLPASWPGRAKVVELTEAYFQLAVQWQQTVVAVVVSCVMLVLYFLTFFLAARACGVVLPVGDFLAIMPAVDVISGLPVSLGGFGVRESVFVLILGRIAGVAAAVAVTISLTGYILSAVWALPGAFLWIYGGGRK